MAETLAGHETVGTARWKRPHALTVAGVGLWIVTGVIVWAMLVAA